MKANNMLNTKKPAMMSGARLALSCFQMVLAFGAVSGVSAAQAAVNAERAKSFVTSISGIAFATLKDKGKGDDVRYPQFKDLILKSFDAAAIGRFVVGSYWAKANEVQQGKFQMAFKEALVRIYLARLSGYTDQDIKVIGVDTTPEHAIVHTLINSATTRESFNVDWLVIDSSGKEQMIDVVIDGVSTSMTTKQDYGSVLRGSDGNLDTLTAKIVAQKP